MSLLGRRRRWAQSPPGRGLGEGATEDVDVLLRTVQQRDAYRTQAVDVRRDLQRLQSEQAGLREYRIAATTKCANLEKVLEQRDAEGNAKLGATPTTALKRGRLGIATVLRGPRPQLGEVLRSPALVERRPLHFLVILTAVESQVPD